MGGIKIEPHRWSITPHSKCISINRSPELLPLKSEKLYCYDFLIYVYSVPGSDVHDARTTFSSSVPSGGHRMLLKRPPFPLLYSAASFLLVSNTYTCLYIWVYFRVLY